MKIALASMDGTGVSNHFGRSPYFLIFNVEKEKIKDISKIDNTFTRHFRKGGEEQDAHARNGEAGHDHSILAEGLKGCDVVIAGGMGQRAYDDLTKNGFDVILTDEADAATAIEKFIKKELTHHTEKLHG